MKALLTTIFGIVLGLIASITGVLWLAVAAAIVTLVGALLQYKDTSPFELIFSESAWQEEEGKSAQLKIPQKQHKKSSPVVTLFMGQHPNFQEVMGDVVTDGDDIVLAAGRPFAGKVVIK